MQSSPNRSIFTRNRVLLPFLLLLVACGSGDEDSPSAPQGGAGGQQQGGSSSGGTSAGISGASGKGGLAGKGGSAGKGGGGGTSQPQGGAGASAGGAGEGGKAGGAGAPGCTQDDECAPLLPSTVNPKDCAEAVCIGETCVIRAKDKDGDGKATKFCKDTAGEVEIVVGNDCDDNDSTRYPGAWDGPEGEGNEASCDGVDNDCSGTPDDNSLTDGTSCTCKPGAVAQCSEDSSGKTIAWPGGAPAGQCKYGSKTCAVDVNTGLGKWGPCTDAVAPGSEICDGVDNDCDGLLDDQDPDTTKPEWTCDGDNDDEASPDAKLLSSCSPPPAEQCPGSNPSWKIKPPKTDCDDSRSDINKKGFEVCDEGPDGLGNDENCDGQKNEGCACKNGMTQPCFTDPNGNPIPSSGGQAIGACKAGTQTCANGQWGACVGGQGPLQEVCANIDVDNDCDGDAADADDRPTYYCDKDSDGFLSTDAAQILSITLCGGAPAAGSNGCAGTWRPQGTPATDCNDGRADVNKNASELCADDGADENCNGQVNEGCGCTNGATQPCFTDPNGNPIPSSGGQAIGACKAGTQTCNGGQWGACVGGQGPAAELCSNLDADNDCDGDAAEADDRSTYHCDTDSDGFLSTDAAQILSITLCGGAPAAGSNGCAGTWRPQGTPATDCNDGRADVNKNASELCANDGADENCNGQVNEGCGCSNGATQSCFTDPNGNPIPSSGGQAIGACKAGTQTCSGGQWGTCVGGQGPALELCVNLGVDNDCDGDAAEADDKKGWWCDGDSDGFAAASSAPVYACEAPASGCAGPNPSWKQNLQPSDCNDGRADVNKNAPEVCADDGADENCDGQVNEATSCACTNGASRACWKTGTGQDIPHSGNSPIGACKAGAETCANGQWGACLNGVGPSGEFCSNINVDNDCDGDAAEASDKSTYYCDKDSDGFLSVLSGQVLSITLCGGAPAAGSNGCAGTWRPQGTPATDCNDDRADINKNAPEVCGNDGADENCDGQVNEGCGCTNGATQPCFTDPNGKAIPNSNGATTGQCKAGTQTCAGGQWGTCLNGIGPSTELCANLGVDNDCDGDAADADDKSTYYCDADSDGHLSASPTTTLACQSAPPANSSCSAAGKWTLSSTPQDDCNDSSGSVYTGATELCGDSVDSNCAGGDSDGYNVGAACNVGGIAVGACLNGGAIACQSAGSTQTVCNTNHPDIGKVKAQSSAAPNASWDWDCSGSVQNSASIPNTSCPNGSVCALCATTVTSFTAPINSKPKQGNNLGMGDIQVAPFINRVCGPNLGTPDTICAGLGNGACGASTVVYVDGCCNDNGNPNDDSQECSGLQVSCGKNITAILCSNSSGSCKAVSYRGGSCPLTQANFTMKCY